MGLLQKIKAGTSNRRTINWPGTDTQIDLRLLSNRDELDSTLAADRLFKDSEDRIEFHNLDAYQTERTMQQLWRACVEHGTDTPIAESIAEFRKLVTTHERDALVDEYNTLAEQCNPSPRELSDDEFDSLVAQLKKKPKETAGSISSLSTLRRLCRYLAFQPATSPRDSGSTSGL
jgi:hypothetical protein